MYTKDGKTISGKRIIIDGFLVLNPTAAQLAEQGWVEVIKPTPEETISNKREDKIWQLKEQLSQSDYKIIKCYEAQLMNSPMPYNYATVIAERQAIRDEINQIEAMTEEEFYEAYPDEREVEEELEEQLNEEENDT